MKMEPTASGYQHIQRCHQTHGAGHGFGPYDDDDDDDGPPASILYFLCVVQPKTAWLCVCVDGALPKP